jgi:hypothetical protein
MIGLVLPTPNKDAAVREDYSSFIFRSAKEKLCESLLTYISIDNVIVLSSSQS